MQGLEYEHVIKFWTNMWAYEPVKVLDEYVGIKESDKELRRADEGIKIFRLSYL